MFLHQQSLDGLGCFSYVIGSCQTGECAVVDPQRDVACYLEIAAAQGFTITHVIETHVHADHVSGCCELAERTGAAISIHAAAEVCYPHVPLADGDRLVFGECVLEVLFTPGHTRDGICLLLSDTSRGDQPVCVLTGDTLLLGDVGRPDLVPGECAEAMAALLYDSLHTRLLTLPDELVVYPGHGAGSLCGRGLRAGCSTTIGEERRTNQALQATSREAFVAPVVSNQPQRPANFSCIKALNTRGAAPLGNEPLRSIAPLEAAWLLEHGHVLVDIRRLKEFAHGHVRGSVNLPLTQQFATRAGQLLAPGVPVVLLADDTPDRPHDDTPEVEEAAVALARVGYDQVVGFIDDGLCGWQAAGLPLVRAEFRQASPCDIARLLGDTATEQPVLIDVREPWEWQQGRLPGAIHIPLYQLERRANEVDPGRPVIAYCKGGTRSQSAALLLAQLGHRAVYNLSGGIDAWHAAGYPVVYCSENEMSL
jgi:hydroxyacylglutathione hydrolase